MGMEQRYAIARLFSGAFTGTSVMRNTQAPFIRSANRSTAGQCFQSRFLVLYSWAPSAFRPLSVIATVIVIG